MIHTTLNRIRACSPCTEGWTKLLSSLGKTKADDEPLSMTDIIDSNGLDDALWCLRAEPQHSAIWRMLAVHYANKVRHLITDEKTIAVINVALRHAHGMATDGDLQYARDPLGCEWAVAATVALADAAEAAWDTAFITAGIAPSGIEYGPTRTRKLNAFRAEQSDDLRTVLTHYNANPGEAIHGWSS